MSPVLPKALPAKALEALARKHGVSAKGTRRQVLRRIGRKILPEFDERAYLGSAAAPPTGSFTEDTFTDADGTELKSHTGEKGAKWTISTGAMKILSGRVYKATTTYAYAYASGLPAGTNYSVECGVYCASAVKSSRFSGPMGRISTEADTSYQWGWETGTGYSLLKRVAGVETVLGTFARVGKEGEEDKAIISMVGTAIKGFVGGVERVAATDAAISAAGRAGFRMQGLETTGPQVNYIIATDIKTVVDMEAAPTGSGSITTAQLGAVASMAGAPIGTGAANGTLGTVVDMQAQPTGQGAATGQMGIIASMAAAPTGVGSLAADLGTITNLAAEPSGQGSITADLREVVSMAGNPSGTAAVTGDFSAVSSMAAQPTAQGSVAGVLGSVASMEAAPAGMGSLVADLAPVASLDAKPSGQGSVAADLRGIVSMEGSPSGTGSVSGELSPPVVSMEAQPQGQGSAIGEFSAVASMEAVPAGAGSIAAELRATANLEVVLEGSGSISAELEAIVISHPAQVSVKVRPTTFADVTVVPTTAVSVSVRPRVAVAIRVRPAK
jgi:hypothetical protein